MKSWPIAPGRTEVAYAAAELEPDQRPVREAVIREDRGGGIRHLHRAAAEEGHGLAGEGVPGQGDIRRVADVEEGEAADQRQVLAEVRPRLELDALDADLAGLKHEAPVVRVGLRRVRAPDVEGGGGQQDVGAGRLVLDAGLVLVAGDSVGDASGGPEGGVEDPAGDDGLEGLAVGDVRRDAAVEQVEQLARPVKASEGTFWLATAPVAMVRVGPDWRATS